MSYLLTDEQEITRQAVREFAEAEVAPLAAEIDRDHRYPSETIPKMAELGLFGMPFPEEVGGSGADWVSYAIAIEELARACATTGVILETHVSLGTWPILTFGTEEQKAKYLPDLTSGRKLASFGLTEPMAGSDVANIATTARLDGDQYVINGQKIFITSGGYSEVFVIFARTSEGNGVKGISAFIIEKGTPGFTIGEGERKLGIRGSSTPPLFFSDVRVPRSAMLGEEGQGFSIAMQALDGGRMGIAAQALGIAQGALDAAVAYAKERVQFGKPIATLQGIQWLIAEMATDVEAARLLVYQSAALMDAGQPAAVAAAKAKLFAGETASRVASKAIQVHGGNGYTEAYPVERAYRDARITQIYEGTNEVQKIVIARSLLR